MKKIFCVLAFLLATLGLPGKATAQSCVGSPAHFSAGIYNSLAYNCWRATITTAPSATGSGTIVVTPAYVTLADGYVFSPFSTLASLTVGVGTANVETVTPTAVSIGTCPSGFAATAPCASVTASFSNLHGQGDQVISGSGGLSEATNDAGNYGGGLVYWQAHSGPVTLSTSGATTTLCSSCIPVNALVLGVTARVTTTITSCTGGWELGDGTTATRFTAANATLTAGTVSAANLQTTTGVASTTTGLLNITSAKSIVNTCVTANAGAGAIDVTAFGFVLATPNS